MSEPTNAQKRYHSVPFYFFNFFFHISRMKLAEISSFDMSFLVMRFMLVVQLNLC